MTHSQILSSNIRLLAMENGISIRQLAEMVDVPQTTLNTALSSKKGVPLDIAIKIADYFRVTIEQLCGKQPIEISIASNDRTNQHIKKYQSLNETGKDQVDSFTDAILTNPANLASPPAPQAKVVHQEIAAKGIDVKSREIEVDPRSIRKSRGKMILHILEDEENQ